MKKALQLSVVVPAFNEEKNIHPLYSKISSVLKKMRLSYEIIFIDDGSIDATFERICEIGKKDKRVHALKFSRNFQKAAALSAGFHHAKGDIIVTMDADLQEDPAEIPRFIEMINESHDLVVGWRANRTDSFDKVFASKVFNFLVRTCTNIKLHDSDCNFRAIRREFLQQLTIYGGLYRYIPSIAASRGARIGELKVRHQPRQWGSSKYGPSRIFYGFIDLVTITFLLNYLKRPLHLFGSIGILFVILGGIISSYLLYVKFILAQAIGERPLLLFAILLILVGIQLFSIGLIGEMVTSISKQTVNDQYVIVESF